MVRLKGTDEVFAMKILNKWEMLKRAEVNFYLFTCRFTVLHRIIKIKASSYQLCEKYNNSCDAPD